MARKAPAYRPLPGFPFPQGPGESGLGVTHMHDLLLAGG